MLYEIYVFSSVQSNSKKFLCTSVHFSVGTCCRSTDIQTIFKLLPRVYQHVRCYKLNCFNDTRCVKSARSRTFLLYTTSFINPHAINSNGVKSGDLGGQAVGPLPTQRLGKFSSRNLVTSLWKLGGSLSCWNTVMKLLCTFNVGTRCSWTDISV
jgi:hypothetical protein